MCAIIAFIIKNPTIKDFDLLKRIFLESKIRGRHSTGISYINKMGNLEKKSIYGDSIKFINEILVKYEDFIDNQGNFHIIGHCRYSTSNLNYNQPLCNNLKSIVHNGVITQEPYNKWEKLYNIKCHTENDSEILLYEDNPIKKFKKSSLATCTLLNNGELSFYRNGKRPLYFCKHDRGIIVVSTKDIAKRSGIESEKCELNICYSYKNFNLYKKVMNENLLEYQI